MESGSRPWFFQVNYLVVCFVCLIMPFFVGAGRRSTLYALLVLAAVFLQFARQRSVLRLDKPTELKCFTLWGIWAAVSGFFVADSPFLLFAGLKTLFRQILMLWAAYAIFVRQRQHSYFYWVLLSLAAMNIVATHFGFHMDKESVSSGFVQDVVDLSSTRAEGLTGNANSMGFSMLAGIWAAMMLWKDETNLVIGSIRRVIFIFAMVVMAYFAIQSGSRKTLLVMGLLAFAWAVWMLPGRFSFKAALIGLFLGIAMLVVTFFVMKDVMTDTVLGRRLLQWLDAGGGSATEGFKENVRYALYIDGFKFWLSHPIAGIGLCHFGLWHWSGLYSHSDYIEPLACTGLVGFILYHGFAWTIIIRLLKLLRRRLPNDVAYAIKGMLMFMLCNHCLIGLGGPHWDNVQHCIIVVFIGTYAFRAWSEFVRHRSLYAT